jgi:hypothetical protein
MQNKKLKIILTANAIFSIGSGLSMLSFGNFLGSKMGIAQPQVFIPLGIGLLLFGLFLIHTARQKFISTKKVKLIIWQDWLWVIGSAIIIATQAFELYFIGYIIIGIVALIVADFAILQSRYIKNVSL